MEPIHILPIEDVLAAATIVPLDSVFEVDGVRLKKNRLLTVILQCGVKCVGCGKSALYFTYFDSGSIHSKGIMLMFDHQDKQGEYAHMTVDHIIPKSKGGLNIKENYQPMCNFCNCEKGNTLDIDNLPDNLLEFVPEKHLGTRIVPLPIKRTITPFRKPKYDPYEIIIYKGYIRWYTSIFHRNAVVGAWNNQIRILIQQAMMKSHPNFNPSLFDVSYNELFTEVNAQPTKNKKGKKIEPKRPATLFSHQRAT